MLKNIESLQKEFDLDKLNHSARTMFCAYAEVDSLYKNKVWLNGKYNKLAALKDDRVSAVLEYFRMDENARAELFRRYTNINHDDFESFRRLANAVI